MNKIELNGNCADATVEELLTQYPMHSIVYEEIDDVLYWEAVQHTMVGAVV